MPGPKPTLGYPSRTEAAIALKREGLDIPAIAAKIGISQGAVSGPLANGGYYALRARRKAVAPEFAEAKARRDEALLARHDGVLLATQAGIVEHRETEPRPTRIVELHLSDADFARLIAAARADGQTPAACARTLVLGALALRENFSEA